MLNSDKNNATEPLPAPTKAQDFQRLLRDALKAAQAVYRLDQSKGFDEQAEETLSQLHKQLHQLGACRQQPYVVTMESVNYQVWCYCDGFQYQLISQNELQATA